MIGPHLLIGIVAVLAASPAPVPCSVMGPLPTPQVLVERAALIIHARAEGIAEVPGTSKEGLVQTQAQVRFRVLSVLKGKFTSDELTFDGEIRPRDDWNDRPVPFDFVRPGGRSGNCVALGYKPGGEYLLLLNPVDPKAADAASWSPYWSALSPTNEQVRGASDPWIAWVSQQIRK